MLFVVWQHSGWINCGKTIAQLETLGIEIFVCVCLPGSIDLGFAFIIYFYAEFQFKIKRKIRLYWLWLTPVMSWVLISILNNRTNAHKISRACIKAFTTLSGFCRIITFLSVASHTHLASIFRCVDKRTGLSNWSYHCGLSSAAIGKSRVLE